MKAVHLKPLSPFTTPFPSSDTLFGAICWGTRHLYGKGVLENLLQSFKNCEPPFLISSVFPREGENYYLPVPRIVLFKDVKIEDFKEMWEIKRKKKMQWLSTDGMNSFIKKEEGLEEILSKEEEKRFVGSYQKPGNAINRLSSATEGNLFFRTVYRHTPKTGLYFLLKAKDKETERMVIGAVRFLQQRGLGGSTSTGLGQFELEEEGAVEFDKIEEVKNPGSFVTLSLYCPTAEEWSFYKRKKEMVSYEIVKRSGVIEASFIKLRNPWKATVYMFKEGSLFPTIEGRKVYGWNPVVLQEEGIQVQHYGHSFSLGVVSE